MSSLFRALTLQFVFVTFAVAFYAARMDPLPSWNDGASKAAIVGFVATVTAIGGTGYVPPAERIAVFDNDGTLWAEQPIYVQLAFAFDPIRALAQQHPEWRDDPAFRAVLDGDIASLIAGGEPALARVMMATHAGMTTEDLRPRCSSGSRRRSIRRQGGATWTWSISRCST